MSLKALYIKTILKTLTEVIGSKEDGLAKINTAANLQHQQHHAN